MSDEQQQQQLQQHKSSKDSSTSNTANAPPRKTNIHELRNQDYVSRLMAATPPYLYSAPVGPNNFFFSDMLRSLVQARNNENARNLQLQQSVVLSRRPRKRSWSQHRPYYENLRERKEIEEKKQLTTANVASTLNVEKPLELTNKPYFNVANKYRKIDETSKQEIETKLQNVSAKVASLEFEQIESSSSEAGGAVVDSTLHDTPPAASMPPQDLVLPPPPPVWYPPLYPPYGIDPLHFFIDLRVSGHIYDRKKENISPLTHSADNSNLSNNESEPTTTINLPNKHRHGSAFTVPMPRSNDGKPPTTNHQNSIDAINLTSTAMANKFENYTKYYDLGDTKENQPLLKSSANYMLQHLPRLYSQFAARDLITSNDNKSEKEPDCDADSNGSPDNCVDVEIIDSIKHRIEQSDSRCSSPDDEASVTQID